MWCSSSNVRMNATFPCYDDRLPIQTTTHLMDQQNKRQLTTNNNNDNMQLSLSSINTNTNTTSLYNRGIDSPELKHTMHINVIPRQSNHSLPQEIHSHT